MTLIRSFSLELASIVSFVLRLCGSIRYDALHCEFLVKFYVLYSSFQHSRLLLLRSSDDASMLISTLSEV